MSDNIKMDFKQCRCGFNWNDSEHCTAASYSTYLVSNTGSLDICDIKYKKMLSSDEDVVSLLPAGLLWLLGCGFIVPESTGICMLLSAVIKYDRRPLVAALQHLVWASVPDNIQWCEESISATRIAVVALSTYQHGSEQILKDNFIVSVLQLQSWC